MTKQKQAARTAKENHLSPQKQERKHHVLSRVAPSMARSIADGVVIKDEDIFLLTEPDGSVPLGEGHGFGLYYHDCRFLSGYEMKIADMKPDKLSSTAKNGFMAIFQLTNPDIKKKEEKLISKGGLGIKWTRVLDSKNLALQDLIVFQNFMLEQIEFPISLTFQADFEDVFA